MLAEFVNYRVEVNFNVSINVEMGETIESFIRHCRTEIVLNVFQRAVYERSPVAVVTGSVAKIRRSMDSAR